MQTTFLSATSNYHQDRKHDDHATLVEGQVGFVALNTNDDAYFDHPDRKVPIREGAFIRFNGSDPHRTVVNKGYVQLLGPFDLKSFEKVTRRTEAPSTSPSSRTTPSPTLRPTPSPTWTTPSPTQAPTTKATKAGKAGKAGKASKTPKEYFPQ